MFNYLQEKKTYKSAAWWAKQKLVEWHRPTRHFYDICSKANWFLFVLEHIRVLLSSVKRHKKPYLKRYLTSNFCRLVLWASVDHGLVQPGAGMENKFLCQPKKSDAMRFQIKKLISLSTWVGYCLNMAFCCLQPSIQTPQTQMGMIRVHTLARVPSNQLHLFLFMFTHLPDNALKTSATV